MPKKQRVTAKQIVAHCPGCKRKIMSEEELPTHGRCMHCDEDLIPGAPNPNPQSKVRTALNSAAEGLREEIEAKMRTEIDDSLDPIFACTVYLKTGAVLGFRTTTDNDMAMLPVLTGNVMVAKWDKVGGGEIICIADSIAAIDSEPERV